MAEVLLASARYVKDSTVINEQVDDKVLTATIRDAQNMHIHTLLGSCLFKEIQRQIKEGFTTEYKDLLDDYILPALTKWVQYELTYMNHFRYRNKGTMVKSSDNSQPIQFSELKFLMDKERNKAEHYSGILKDYLECNCDIFTEYKDCGCCDGLEPSESAFSTGMYLGLKNIKTINKYDKDKGCC